MTQGACVPSVGVYAGSVCTCPTVPGVIPPICRERTNAHAVGARNACTGSPHVPTHAVPCTHVGYRYRCGIGSLMRRCPGREQALPSTGHSKPTVWGTTILHGTP